MEPSSRRLLQAGEGPVAGGVRRTAGPGREEVRDGGQQVRLPRAERGTLRKSLFLCFLSLTWTSDYVEEATVELDIVFENCEDCE